MVPGKDFKMLSFRPRSGRPKGGGVSEAREHIQSFQLDSRFRGNDSSITDVKKC